VAVGDAVCGVNVGVGVKVGVSGMGVRVGGMSV